MRLVDACVREWPRQTHTGRDTCMKFPPFKTATTPPPDVASREFPGGEHVLTHHNSLIRPARPLLSALLSLCLSSPWKPTLVKKQNEGRKNTRDTTVWRQREETKVLTVPWPVTALTFFFSLSLFLSLISLTPSNDGSALVYFLYRLTHEAVVGGEETKEQ